MADFVRIQERFVSRGIQIARPVDLLEDGKFSRLKNVISHEDGSLEPRPGLIQVNATALAAGAAHSVRRLNDQAAATFRRIVGAGTKLHSGQASFAEITDMLGALGIGTGFSGQPISMVPFRPDRSPEPWMYCADKNKMAKVRPDGKAANIGIAPPLVAPSVTAIRPTLKVLERFNTTPVNWSPSGVAGAITPIADGHTLDFIVYDSGTTGWASMLLNLGTNVGPGVLITLNDGGGNAEEVVTTQVLRAPVAVAAAATISRIIYDSSGSTTGTGLCSIVPSVPISDLAPNAVIILDSGGANDEKVRIIASVVHPDGTVAIRVSTTLNHLAGETITGRPVHRAFTVNTHGAAEPVKRFHYRNDATGAGTYIIERTVNLDLTFTDTPDKQQLKLDDEIHLSLFILGLERVTDGKVMFDVDHTTNDFTRNFFYFTFGPNDLVPIAQSTNTVPNTLSDAQTVSQIEDTSIPTTIRGQMGGAFQGTLSPKPGVGRSVTGDNQWSELRFKLRDLVRVGADEAKGLSDIKKVRIQMRVNNNIAVIAASSLWIGGSYGPDSGQFGAPYFYRFRARQPNTGARSLTSPATRFGTQLRRQSATIIMPYVTDPQVDSTVGGVLDVFRFGGNLLSWRYVGSTPNLAAGNNSFVDSLPDDEALANPAEETETFQPFPVTDRPKSGTCDICGSTVIWKTGDKFDIRWAPGTEIRIAGLPYTLYSQPTTFSALPVPEADMIQLVENGKSQTAVPFVVEEPTLLAQPLEVMWGPLPDTGEMFAVGDLKNPGRLYWTNPQDPDSANETNTLDVTQPSEPLIAGAILRDGINVLFSSERAFRVLRSQSNPGSFIAIPIQNSKGLLAPWVLCTGGPVVYYRGKDGCYVTDGSSADPVSITDDDLYPLFPHDGVAGIARNGLIPPDDALPADQRMSFDNQTVRYSYKDTTGVRQTLVYSVLEKGWYPWNYPSSTPLMFYDEEGEGVNSLLAGGADGRVYTVGGTNDQLQPIACEIRPRSVVAQDYGNEKLWGDYKLDMQGLGIVFTITQLFNAEQLSLTPVAIPSVAARALMEITTNAGNGQDAISATISIAWSSGALVPLIYGWEVMGSHYPAGLLAVKTIAGSHALKGYQHVREFYPSLIAPADVTFSLIVDGVARTYTIPATGTAHLKPRIPVDAVKGKMFSYKLTSAQVFKFFVGDSELLLGEWGRTGPYEVIRPFGPSGP